MSIERGFINKNIAPIYRKALYSEEKYLCKYVDKFIFITNGLRDYYNKKIGIKKNQQVFVSPSGIDIKLFKKIKSDIRTKYKIKKDEVLIGSVGGIANIRKLDNFLQIFKKAVSKNNKIKLMFVGEGDALDNLKDLTKELNLQKNVIFVGKIEHNEVPKYLSVFDFGLCHLPNIFIYKNSVPLKVLEYLACDVPVLASEIKAHSEMSKKLKGIFIYKTSEDLLRVTMKNKSSIKQNLEKWSWPYLAEEYKRVWSS